MGNETPSDYSCFKVEVEAGVAHLKLIRAESFNSMTRSFWRELPAIVNDLDQRGGVRAIVISSTGKHFSAGMDLSVFADEGITGGEPVDRHVAAEAFRHKVKGLQETFSCLERARMPVIMAIQGGCIGGAVDFATACDIRYATSDAYFVIQEINIGMTADVGTFPRLCKLIPEGWVKELAYTGRKLPAQKALELGLVNAVFDSHEAVVAHALETAREIASKTPLAVTGSKVIINYARDHSVADTLDYLAVWQSGMLAGPHMAEAFAAKASKREPVYPDLAPIKAGI
ncbi:crotonase/enoyl-CoA hydratase family protein [Caulobacter sp. CCNWLY153]|uniref:Crotonase/enoyl-CoA hydratase family protein n=1 Tax=Caulobacter radicis TaxID=2172650 RepID=A0A2T9J3P9_9CAUL|nr:crotonase/enoyl-CoA hydratase family protein [Caulobacter radicis]PVM75192.1 crotonase/enoyl-CoA hydratase family protein [Caulobacter radicis]